MNDINASAKVINDNISNKIKEYIDAMQTKDFYQQRFEGTRGSGASSETDVSTSTERYSARVGHGGNIVGE